MDSETSDTIQCNPQDATRPLCSLPAGHGGDHFHSNQLDRLWDMWRYRQAEREWRVTYDVPWGGPIREGFGLDGRGARAAAERYRAAGLEDVQLWSRPRSEKWFVEVDW